MLRDLKIQTQIMINNSTVMVMMKNMRDDLSDFPKYFIPVILKKISFRLAQFLDRTNLYVIKFIIVEFK